MKNTIQKYPSTQHIEGSNLQEGDYDLSQIPFSDLQGKHIIVEEKVDGGNSGVSYSDDYEQLLQSRGHYLSGGPRERHFAPLKSWASFMSDRLLECLENRYVMYGEWMYAKHTLFYDSLPHFFMEFDVLDTQEGTYIDAYGHERQGTWLSTERRREILKDVPIVPVKVLYEGIVEDLDHLKSFIGPSNHRTENWWDVFKNHFPKYNENEEEVLKGTDAANLMEGLYIKVEEDGKVVGRYKWVRYDFFQKIMESGSHWLERPIIPNLLAEGVDLYA